MSAPPDVGIGIVGYGFMGRAHAYGYTVAPRIRDRRTLKDIETGQGEAGGIDHEEGDVVGPPKDLLFSR